MRYFTNRTNREGLTFEEWVCAAGVANIDPTRGVLPYSESTTSVREARPGESFFWHKGVRYHNVRHTTYRYSKAIRKAWKDGEDPTEWRAGL